MDKICIVMLILGLMIGMNSCGRSTEKSETSRSIEKSEEELNEMEKEVIGEEKMFEEETMAPEEEIGGEAEVPDEEWDNDESPLFE